MNANSEFLDRQDCVLLLVDVQKSMLDLCEEPALVLKSTAALIEIAGLCGVPVLFTAQNVEKLGGVIPELIAAAPPTSVLPKMEFNCFENEGIAAAVRETGRKTLLLAGIEGHICIFHTGLGALRRGFRVHIASDAVTSKGALNKETGLRRLDRAGAVISSTGMMIFELLQRAGTAEFRAALPLLKKL